MAYFPMFLDIEGKHCLVVGGGKVALRKAQVLLDFGAHVTVVAQQIEKEIKDIAEQSQRKADEISSMGFPRSEERSKSYGQVTIYERAYTEEDLQDKVFVVAATDNAAVNHEIAEDARKRNIPVNAVDQPEDCTFIFPSYIRKKNVVGAFSSAGNSPVLTQYLKKQMQEILTDELGEINEYMGSIRSTVKASLDTERERKIVYRKVFQTLLERKEAGEDIDLSEREWQEILDGVKSQ